jgi:phage-related protein
MRLRIVCVALWTIAAPVDAHGRCSVQEVLDTLERTDRAARAQILTLIARVARHGPPSGQNRSRSLGGGIYELKTHRGWRIFYFTDRGRLIVCSEMCRKPKPRELRTIVARAQRERAVYLADRTAGRIVMEGSPWQD